MSITKTEASYIIYSGSNLYWAKNGSTGIIDYSGSDASTVIQSAIDDSIGGMVYLKRGIYPLTSTLTLGYPITLRGEGISVQGTRTGSILRVDTGDIDAITIARVGYLEFGLTVSDLMLEGNNNGRYGLNIGSSARLNFERLYIRDFTDFGIYDSGSHSNTYYKVHVVSCGTGSELLGGAVLFGNCPVFIQCEFQSCGSGFIIRNGYGATFVVSVFENNEYHGIYGYSTSASNYYPQHVTLDACQFELNNQSESSNIRDIFLEDSNVSYWDLRDIKISGGYVDFAVYSSGWWTYMQNIRCGNSKKIFYNGRYGTIDCEMTFLDSTSLPLNVGVETIGSGSRSYGYASGSNGMQIAHNLVYIPNIINVKTSGSTPSYFSTALSGSNHFYVYHTGSGNELAYFFWDTKL